MAGKKSLFALDPDLESQFRQRVQGIYGSKKGALSHAMNQALSYWLERHKDSQPTRIDASSPDENSFVKREDVTFQAVFKRIVAFFAICRVLYTLIDHATFVASPTGILFRGMDPSHIALMDVEISAADLDLLQCENKIAFGVNVNNIRKFERLLVGQQPGEIFIDNRSSLMLRDYRGREIQSGLVESMTTGTPLPKLSFNSKVVLKTAFLHNEFNNLSASSIEHITLRCTPDGQLELSGGSEDNRYKWAVPKPAILDIHCSEESESTYSLDYLAKILEAGKRDFEECTIEYSSKMPLRILFSLQDHPKSTIAFYLAPRVQ